MIVRMRVVHVAVVVAVFGVVVVTVGIVVHAVHLLYFTHLRCRAQPGANESKAHRLIMLSAASQQKAHRPFEAQGRQECPSRLRTSLCYQWEV